MDESAIRRTLEHWGNEARALLPEGLGILDAHTHLGVDSDGSQVDWPELRRQLDLVGVGRAVSAPLHTPGGYERVNRELLETARDADGRVLPLWRVDPGASRAREELEWGLAHGAVGAKMHPRAERFRMDHPGLADLLAPLDERGGMLLIHSGRGMPALGESVIELARALPRIDFVLAHCAISDLAWIVDPAYELPNVLFDTSWWNPIDIVAVLNHVCPSRVVFGSDPPYGTVSLGIVLTARAALAAGYSGERLAALFGGNAAAIVDRSERNRTVDLGFVAGNTLPPIPWQFDRACMYLTAAISSIFATGGPGGDEALELASNALELAEHDPRSEPAAAIREHIALARQVAASGEANLAAHVTICALTCAATPDLPVPGIPG